MAQSNYSTAVLADSPVAFYKLDEASGLPQDSSGNTYHMTASSGTASYQYDSPFSGAQGIRFNSGATTINLSRALFSTATNNITFEVWIKILSVPSSGRSFIDAGTTSGGWLISFFDSPEEYLDFSHVSRTTYPGPRIVRMGWRQYVIVRRSGTYEIYVDGDFWPSGGNTAMDAPVGNFAIGGVYLDLVLSNISYYETALSATRIKAHYDAAMDRPQPPTNTYAQEVMVDTPYAYWKFDEASGSAADSSGNGFTASNTGPTYTTYRYDSPFEGAYGIRLTDNNAYFQASNVAYATDNVTFECWVKSKAVSGGDGDVGFWRLKIGQFCFRYRTNKNLWVTVDSVAQTDGPAFGAGNDYHYLVIQRVSGVWKYYIDGDLWLDNAGSTAPPSYSEPNLMGFGMDVVISNFAIYNSVLSAARIKAHYNAAMRYVPSYQRVSQGARLNG